MFMESPMYDCTGFPLELTKGFMSIGKTIRGFRYVTTRRGITKHLKAVFITDVKDIIYG